jgi:general secretion pathway protein F/type IV pilus assembly protein PilC
MPDFAYIARDPAGARVTGSVTAASEHEVLTILSGKSLFPVNVSLEKAGANPASRKRVGGQLMANTYNQLSSLLRSGVPLLRSIRVIRDQTSNTRLQEVLDDVYHRVEDGSTLGEAMNRYPRVFSEMAINMVRAGGEGGFLEDALDRVSKFTEESEDLKSRTIGALAYPFFLAIVGTLVVGGLVIFFVPRFGEMFDGLRKRGELPMLTDWLMWISDLLGSPVVVVGGAAVFAAVFLLVRQRLETEQGKRMRDLVKLRMPMLGPIFTSLAVARFCRVLGTLLTNGVPILKSLQISRLAAGNRILSEAIEGASENISSGQSLAAPLAKCSYFPGTVVEMISVAEESNTLDRVLVDIAEGLERRTVRKLDLVVRLLEPMMLLVLAAVVLCVVIALLMPIMKMSSMIQ